VEFGGVEAQLVCPGADGIDAEDIAIALATPRRASRRASIANCCSVPTWLDSAANPALSPVTDVESEFTDVSAEATSALVAFRSVDEAKAERGRRPVVVRAVLPRAG